MALECIDMSAADKHTQAAQIREACLSSGFFYIVNHGIDRKLVEEVFAKSKAFFALPEAEKMKVFRDKNQRGYTPFDYEVIGDACSKADTKESYYIGSTIPGSDIPFYSPNQFPSSEDMPGWKETMEQYYKELVSLCKRLASLFALALNLDESFFDQKGIIDKAASMMRLIHYNAEKSSEEDGIYGVGAHCDWGFLTLLVTDDVPGLQICRDQDGVPQVWEDVPPMEGAFIVNLGQMLERWTNGLFRATLHRVMSNGTDRYSIPFFFNLNYDCVVECFSTCCSEDNPPKYPPISSGEYLTSRYKATHKHAFVEVV